MNTPTNPAAEEIAQLLTLIVINPTQNLYTCLDQTKTIKRAVNFLRSLPAVQPGAPAAKARGIGMIL
jgi:hypothetical protein